MTQCANTQLIEPDTKEDNVPLYDQKSALHEFVMISGVPVKIMRTKRGGHCCMTDAMPDETICPVCGGAIEAETVYFPIIGEKPLLLYATAPETARDLAAKWITEEKVPGVDVRDMANRDTLRPGEPDPEDTVGLTFEMILKQAEKLGWGAKLMAFVKSGDESGDPNKSKIPNLIPRRR